MRVADVMTRDVQVIAPHRSVRDAARLMDELNVGVLPVCDGSRLVGMITDRDIAVRSTATGTAPDRHRVEEIMSTRPRICREDDDAETVLCQMSEAQIRRMPVLDRERRLVGIVALGDLAAEGVQGSGTALRRISSPAEPDRSGTPTQMRAEPREGRAPRLTDQERAELDRRRARDEADERVRAEERAASDIGPPSGDLSTITEGSGEDDDTEEPDDAALRRARRGSGEGWTRDEPPVFRFHDEDDRRAAFSGSFNSGNSRTDTVGGVGARMPGGFGGDGYTGYGRGDGRGAGAGGGGDPSYADHSGYGSYRDGSARHAGTEGEEGYDRGVRSADPAPGPTGGTRSRTETRADRPESGHQGRGPRGYRRADHRIHEEVCQRLADDPFLDAGGVEVAVEGGEVHLQGMVQTRADRRRAEDLAEAVRGVRHVRNDLRAAAR